MLRLLCFACAFVGLVAERNVHYTLVIDAGSTGSRAYIFVYEDDDVLETRSVRSIQGKKAMPGLSSFSSHPQGVTDYFEPLFLHAVDIIPPKYHNETLVYIKGTAGMRLLKEEEQDAIWDSLVQGLDEHHNVPFIIQKENFGTIDGHREAYYAVLASNYISGSIDGNLVQTGVPMMGALDMGGSSTQLIFHTGTPASQPVQMQDFWSHSWLNFGVDRVRVRVWDFLVAQNGGPGKEAELGQEAGVGHEPVIANPCAFAGYEIIHSHRLLHGTGDMQACQKVLLATTLPHCDASSVPCYIDNIAHPSLQGHKFFGMSVYFYAFDCIRQLSGVELEHWPKPTIAELEEAVEAFCAHSWDEAQSKMLPGVHPFTRDYQLTSRCLETTYLVTLLRYGFGVNSDSRDIELALEVKGFEVEWTLGFALSEVCIECLEHHTTVRDSLLHHEGQGHGQEKQPTKVVGPLALFAPLKALLQAARRLLLDAWAALFVRSR